MGHIHNILFSLKHMIVLNKLERYITLNKKGLHRTNIQAYLPICNKKRSVMNMRMYSHFIYFVTYEWAQFRLFHYTNLERLACDTHSSLLGPFMIYKENEMLCIWGRIHNTSFPFFIMNGLNKLVCYITLTWKGLQGTNTQAYLAHLQIKIEMLWIWGCIHNTLFSLKHINVFNKLERYIILTWKSLQGTNTQAYLPICN